jgi:PAP2 superfamily
MARVAVNVPTQPGRFARLHRLSNGYGAAQQRHWRLVAAIQVLYASLLAAYLIGFHTWPSPDLMALAFLGFAVLAARGIGFLWDWSPFILLLLCYIALTGVIGGVVTRVHLQTPIDADRLIGFGHLPTLVLQAHFWHPDAPRWYDYAAVMLYPMHFIAPLVLAFVLWQWRGGLYWRFVASYLLLCYSAFATYLLYPAAPPWWASDQRRIPTVTRLLSQVPFGRAGTPVLLAERFFQTNPVAAMPSLHAAAPVLVWLVSWRVWPRWGWMVVVYPLAMALAVVYLGEHYVIDVLVGWVYAFVAFAAIWGVGSKHFWRVLLRLSGSKESRSQSSMAYAGS